MMLLLLSLLSACARAESPKAKRDIFIFLKKVFSFFFSPLRTIEGIVVGVSSFGPREKVTSSPTRI